MLERITARDIEIIVARHFNWRQNIIVPNISWGLLNWGHEVDVLIIHPSGWADEVEIKVRASDIRADTKKRHRQRGREDILKRLWFAVPENLSDHPDIPDDAGILAYRKLDGGAILITKRGPRSNKYARKLTKPEIEKALHLGCMRIWHLKEALNKSREARPA